MTACVETDFLLPIINADKAHNDVDADRIPLEPADE